MSALLSVRVQARSKSPGVERLADGGYRVRVAAAPDRGRANREVIERLAEHLDIPPSRLTIVRGETASSKWIKIEP
jgi:uncharacterized protein YggU (UPF0235/DUF167 family)